MSVSVSGRGRGRGSNEQVVRMRESEGAKSRESKESKGSD